MAAYPALVAAAAGAGKHFIRTDPKHLFLKEQIEAGSFGTITRASAWNCHVPGSSGREPWTDLPPQPKAPLHQFVEAVAGGDTGHLVTPSEAAARVVVMAAMYKAARTGSWVDVA